MLCYTGATRTLTAYVWIWLVWIFIMKYCWVIVAIIVKNWDSGYWGSRWHPQKERETTGFVCVSDYPNVTQAMMGVGCYVLPRRYPLWQPWPLCVCLRLLHLIAFGLLHLSGAESGSWLAAGDVCHYNIFSTRPNGHSYPLPCLESARDSF